MSAPPGFNPNDSLLPDPGANSAPIHIMKGGGLVFQNGGFTPMEEETLEKYQMGPGGLLESEIPTDVKTAFLQQLKSFDNGSLNLSTLKKDQWAILKVIQALLEKQRKLLRANSLLNVPAASAPEEVIIPEEEIPNTPSPNNAPPANNENLPEPGNAASGTVVSSTQAGGSEDEDVVDTQNSSEQPKTEEEIPSSSVEYLNTKSIGKTRKRQAGGKPKLRPFARAKTHGKKH